MGYSNFAKRKIVDKVFNRTDFVPPTTYYLAFCTTAGDDNTLGTEPAIGTNGYQRVAITPGTAMFPLSDVNGLISNAQEIASAVSSGVWAAGAAFVAVFFMDAASGGNIWARGTIAAPSQQAITGANQQLVIPIGDLDIQQNN